MELDIKNYKCPSCSAPLRYDGPTEKLVCDFCDSSYTIEEIKAIYAEQYHEEDQPQPSAPTEDAGYNEQLPAGMKVFNCTSCGAQLVVDETTAASACPYCGNATVLMDQLDGSFKPDYVVPFKLTKQQAEETLKQFYNGKKFLPRAFANNNHISEIKGVYVPFWLYDGQAEGDMTFNAENTRQYKEGDYRIIEHSHFRVHRRGTLDFERVPVDASSKMPDAHMDAIEPFDYSTIKPFSSAYLPGFLAEKYDEDDRKCVDRARMRMENSTLSEIRSTVTGYESVSTAGQHVEVRFNPAKYALLPVWMLHTKWNNQDFLFAMNGQTGKMVGDLPVDKGKMVAWFAGIAVPLMAILGFFLLR
ncbi:MAG: hypothetical protein IKS27_01225 [Oscillospiraceae bacterium]|jgi:DNA-directed RNA polymerase subunit RPC12/RpoP|nr:hypothetical protein [Oscillospiraceae bacterium]MBQ8929985.1 hypothetical protein [Oscillospiraceae bacterium]MBR6429815.1 hypothetical protein [Oscillospiraceae bacterium]